jgi:hypothetical protein
MWRYGWKLLVTIVGYVVEKHGQIGEWVHP